MFQKWWCNLPKIASSVQRKVNRRCVTHLWIDTLQVLHHLRSGHYSIIIQETNFNIFLSKMQRDSSFQTSSDLIFWEVWFQEHIAETMTSKVRLEILCTGFTVHSKVYQFRRFKASVICEGNFYQPLQLVLEHFFPCLTRGCTADFYIHSCKVKLCGHTCDCHL